ncbi:uncharacterized protein [Spinacia oleracea]|uniref:Uncharacterized protein isoform X2 n=1 Tax=Spinacia oleracea TaxID=3562 RepID=A0ABM3QT06_SPIOL|nr:uncharacterized protein LOC110793247 isoform X2 [Spinacia oleracea]
MLKLCSNGVQFRTHFTLHLKRVFLYSTSSQTDISSSSMVDFMVKSLGFSRAEAITSWKKGDEVVLEIMKDTSGKWNLRWSEAAFWYLLLFSEFGRNLLTDLCV